MMPVACEYLVNYGRTACLGRFVGFADAAFVRGDRVVVQSRRGTESGIVLGNAPPRFAHLVGVPSGDIVRRLSGEDEAIERANGRKASELIRDAQFKADILGLPLAILDVEVLLNRDHAILHILPFAECNPAPLCDQLSMCHELKVSFLDPRTPPEPESNGCGKPGCGSEKGSCSDCGSGGGCSTGGCSSGKVNDAKELTDYFVQLRKQMEREVGRMPLHG